MIKGNGVFSVRLGAAALALTLALSGAAVGQVNPFGRNAPGLNKGDLDQLMTAAAKLYKASNPRVGRSAQWSNAKTGNQGTVDVVGVDGNCVRLRHRIKQKGVTDTKRFVVRRCRSGGQWQLKN